MQSEGDYPPPPGCPEWMGLEIAGVIVEIGEEAKAKEVCDSYLAKIKEDKVFSEEEYLAVEKEFKEKIYIL